MASNIKKFLDINKKRIENKKYNDILKNLNPLEWEKLKETYYFQLTYDINEPMTITLNKQFIPVINLDEEDIEYFVNKYSKLLDKELEDKINKLKIEYGK